MLPLKTKQSGGKLLPQSDLQRGVFLQEMSCRRYDFNTYSTFTDRSSNNLTTAILSPPPRETQSQAAVNIKNGGQNKKNAMYLLALKSSDSILNQRQDIK
jgi:hypothetical protein